MRPHRRPQGSHRQNPQEPDEARFARRQSEARGARGRAAPVCRPRASACASCRRCGCSRDRRRTSRRRRSACLPARRRRASRIMPTRRSSRARARSAAARCRSMRCPSAGIAITPRAKRKSGRRRRALDGISRAARAGDRPYQGRRVHTRSALPGRRSGIQRATRRAQARAGETAHDRRHRRPHRPRQDDARQSADRRRHRSPAGRKGSAASRSIWASRTARPTPAA